MLPRSHRVILKYLLTFLNNVSKKSDINKMKPANIAIVFAPNLLKPEGDDILTQIADSAYSNRLMEVFVTEYEKIFKVSIYPFCYFIICYIKLLLLLLLLL